MYVTHHSVNTIHIFKTLVTLNQVLGHCYGSIFPCGSRWPSDISYCFSLSPTKKNCFSLSAGVHHFLQEYICKFHFSVILNQSHAIELIKRAVNLLIKKVIFSLIVVALKMFSTTTTSVSMLISYDSQSWWFFLRSFWLDYYVCILSEKNPRKVKNSEQTGQAFTCWFSIITNLACFCYPYAFPPPMRSSKFSHVISYNV